MIKSWDRVYVLFHFVDDPVNFFYWVSFPYHNMDKIHDSFSENFHSHCLLQKMTNCTYSAVVYKELFEKCFLNDPDLHLKEFDIMYDVIEKLFSNTP